MFASVVSLNGQIELSIKKSSSTLPEITLSAPAGDYVIQRAPSIDANASWVALTNIFITDTALTVHDKTSSGNDQQYYRAILLLPPILANPNPERLVWIPPGAFMMGSPLTEADRGYNEGPPTRVSISRGFWMGKYEVTQREFQALRGYNPSHFTGDMDRPVDEVTWYGAMGYCFSLTADEAAAGRLPSGYEYRLPTEAEWEYACRAGTTTRFSYGDDLDYSMLTDYAWCADNSYSTTMPFGEFYIINRRYYTTHRVGQKLPNPWGLYDMQGNVSEWCLDLFANALPGGMVTDPKMGGLSDVQRAVRGSYWLGIGRNSRSACRNSSSPEVISNTSGFRVVLAPTL